jgi:hypothetical protein
LPGGVKRLMSRFSSTSAPSSEAAWRKSTIVACAVQADGVVDGAKWARARPRIETDLPM